MAMSTTYKFTNNAESTLATDVGGSDISFSVASGEGSLFPEVASGDGNQFYILVEEGSTSEWMLVTVRSTDTFTVTRGGTNSFSAGATVSLRLNATILDSFLQKGVERKIDGSPDGSLAAAYSGEEVLDTTNNVWYKHCTGTTWKS